jgi:hypothetical protein
VLIGEAVMTIISDKVKFFDALKVDKGILRFSGNAILKFILAVVIVLALWLLMEKVGAVISIVVIGGYAIMWAYNATRPNRFKSINTALGILGETIADAVFVPVVGMAICDGSIQTNEEDYIKEEMREWGYSDEFIEQFIHKKSGMHIDSIRLSATDLPRILRIKFQRKKGEGKISPKDINRIELCRKSYTMCEALYNDTNNGLHNAVSDHYLSELKGRFKI